MAWRCWFGRHEWARIGSAPASLTVYDRDTMVWGGPNGTNLVPQATTLEGFVILVECVACGVERGYGEYAGQTVKRTAAYARAFIEAAPEGHLRKGDR